MTVTFQGMDTIIGAAAGLGTAAFGIVETMKSRSAIGQAGFNHIRRLLGPLLKVAVCQAYGKGYMDMLQAQYKSDQRELRRSLRQGVRVGLSADNAGELADFVGIFGPKEMDVFISAAGKAVLRGQTTDGQTTDMQGQQLNDLERMLLARYEMAVDGRIEAALSVAQTSYACTARGWAMGISMVIAISVCLITGANVSNILNAIMIGLLAVPVAPIAKDLSEAIKSLRSGLKGKS